MKGEIMKEKYSVFANIGYRPRYYLRHPFEWIKMKCRQIKWAYQRVRYGWCESDTWDIDSWFLKVFPNMLNHYADETHSYPGTEEYPTYESWRDKLYEVAAAIKGYNETEWDSKNEYYNEYYEELRNWQVNDIITRGPTPAYYKYRARDEELAAEAYEKFKDAMIWVIEHFHSLWD